MLTDFVALSAYERKQDTVLRMFYHELASASEAALGTFQKSKGSIEAPMSRSLGQESVAQLVCVRTLIQVCGSLVVVDTLFSELFAAASAKERLMNEDINEQWSPLTEIHIDTLIDMGVVLTANPEVTMLAVEEYKLILLDVARTDPRFSKYATSARVGLPRFMKDLDLTVNGSLSNHLEWRRQERQAAEALQAAQAVLASGEVKPKESKKWLTRIFR